MCYVLYYDMKGEIKDSTKALKLYKEAANIKQPEALTFCAIVVYQSMLMGSV